MLYYSVFANAAGGKIVGFNKIHHTSTTILIKFLPSPTRILEHMSQTSWLSDFLSHVDQLLRPIHPCFINNSDTDNPLLVLAKDPP